MPGVGPRVRTAHYAGTWGTLAQGMGLLPGLALLQLEVAGGYNVVPRAHAWCAKLLLQKLLRRR